MANPLPKILSIVALLVSLPAGWLSYSSYTKLQSERAEVEQAKAGFGPLNEAKEKAQHEAKTLKDQLTAATTGKEAAEAQLSAAKAAAEKAEADLKSTADQLNTAKTQLANAANQQAALPAAAPAVDPELDKKLKEAQAALEEKKQIEAALTAKNNDLAALVKNYEVASDLRAKQANKPGLQGTVLAVNPGWNFVVLSIGDKQGVAANSTLLIKRGATMVAKVRVTSVEPAISIADIVPTAAGKKFHVQPGDLVIYSGI